MGSTCSYIVYTSGWKIPGTWTSPSVSLYSFPSQLYRIIPYSYIFLLPFFLPLFSPPLFFPSFSLFFCLPSFYFVPLLISFFSLPSLPPPPFLLPSFSLPLLFLLSSSSSHLYHSLPLLSPRLWWPKWRLTMTAGHWWKPTSHWLCNCSPTGGGLWWDDPSGRGWNTFVHMKHRLCSFRPTGKGTNRGRPTRIGCSTSSSRQQLLSWYVCAWYGEGRGGDRRGGDRRGGTDRRSGLLSSLLALLFHVETQAKVVVKSRFL